MADIRTLADLIKQSAFYGAGGSDETTADKINKIFGSINTGVDDYLSSAKVRQEMRARDEQSALNQQAIEEGRRQMQPLDVMFGKTITPKITAGIGTVPAVQTQEESVIPKELKPFGKLTVGETAKLAGLFRALNPRSTFNEEVFVNPQTRDISHVQMPGYFRVSSNVGVPIATQPTKEAAVTQRQEEKEIRGEERTAAKEAEKLSAEQEKSFKNLQSVRSYIDEYFRELDKISPPSDRAKNLAQATGKSLISKVPIAGTVIAPEFSAFRKFREASKPKIARALGDVGNLSQSEQETAINLLSDPTTSKTERDKAKKLIEDILITSEERSQESLSGEKAKRAQGFLNRNRLYGGNKVGFNQTSQSILDKYGVK